MLESSGFGPCVTIDTVNTAQGASGPAVTFIQGDTCYVMPSLHPNLGAQGAFTITFWMKQEIANYGTVIEKYSENRETILRLRISSSRTSFMYRTIFGHREMEIQENITPGVWTHVTLQVYDTTASFFMNGTSVGYSSASTAGMVGTVFDQDGIFRIGQDHTGIDQFKGTLQDIRFFTETLTNREIDEVYSGILPKVTIQSNCRCPPTHPRVKPLQTRFCIRNGVADNFGDEVLRMNNNSHHLEYINDGDSSSIWISAFLDDVTIEVDLQDQFQVFFVMIQFYSPQPKVMTIEKRVDKHSPWQRWQLYAEDCQMAFGMTNNGILETAASVNCIQFNTNGLTVPYSKGNITFSVLSPEPVSRPGHKDFYNTPELKEFVKASNIRIRMQDHYYVSHARHMYYGVYEYIVTGRCNCHGHAETCDLSQTPYTCNCLPESNTQGAQCDRCLPLYNDKAFRDGDTANAYSCRPCQCYSHADSCEYDPEVDLFPDDHDKGGGGVCLECQHNTEGRRCDTCISMFYRPIGKSLYAQDVCSPCQCFAAGVQENNMVCEKVGGQCSCKLNVEGRQCDRCTAGYFNLQTSNPVGCESCTCHTPGTINAAITCHETLGQCQCKANVRNTKCDACQYGFYNLDANNPLGCSPCDCEPTGSLSSFCDPVSGQCVCQENREGRQCNQCVDGYTNFQAGCTQCDCNTDGTVSGTNCNKTTGQCVCKPNVIGINCDQCANGYYQIGSDAQNGCSFCGCDAAGTVESSNQCDVESGQCVCKSNVEGRTCNQCKGNTYNLTLSNNDGCTWCNCDATGTIDGDTKDITDLPCDHNTGQCACLANRYGTRCDQCNSGTYKSVDFGGGCLGCDCWGAGTISNTQCDPVSGQCQCKPGGTGIGGRRCETCIIGYFGSPTQGCELCACDEAGSVNTTCNIDDGQCDCKQYTTGRTCGSCKPGTSDLDASNPYGCSSAPSQQPPPEHEPVNSTTLRLFWAQPDYPNGVILSYSVYRDNLKIVKLDAAEMEYYDTELTPFTSYIYQVEAENAYGTTLSPSVTFRTTSGAPSGDITLIVSNVTARNVFIQWSPPSAPNGVINRYDVNSKVFGNDSVDIVYSGLSLSSTLDKLVPYTNYTFWVSACTIGGCVSSNNESVITKQAPPEGQQPPDITPISSSAFFIEWDPPIHSNGIIIYYELWIRGTKFIDGERVPAETRIFHPSGQYNPRPTATPQENALEPPQSNFTMTGLDPYTLYELQVISENILGKTASMWTSARTLESMPVDIASPIITAVSSTSLSVSWTPPTQEQVRGEIVLYTVFIYLPTDLDNNPFAPPYMWTATYTGNSSSLEAVIQNLEAYETYQVMLGVCNNIGCVNSTITTGTTLIGVPEDLKAPTVEGYNDTTMSITWDLPVHPNGPPPSYIVRRMNGAFNYPPPDVFKGTRFPGGGYYKFPPETIKQGVAFTGFDIWFKTTQRDGLILFAASEGGQEEFVALQLRSGRPWFLFDPQECVVQVSPNFTIAEEEHGDNFTLSDGKWHHLVAERKVIKGTIIIDDIYKGEKEAACATGNIIGDNTGVYLGGLPKDFNLQREEEDPRAEVNSANFQGCLRDLKILTQVSPEYIWTPLDWGTVTSISDAQPDWEGCPSDLESGYHFLGTGYSVYKPGVFVGGINVEISFFLRTELKDGLLFFVYGGTNTYILIQMVSGGIHFQSSNGLHTELLLFPNNTVNLCDGLWHRVEIEKRRSRVQIIVDNLHSRESGNVQEGGPITLGSEVYIGGIPSGSEGEQFLEKHSMRSLLQRRFGGCLKLIRVTKRPYFIEQDSIDMLNVKLDGCPAEVASTSPCQSTLTQVIYEGNDTSAVDQSLTPFTEYMYSVEAVNEAGSVMSAWTGGRTREGAPTGVSGPRQVRVLSGYRIHSTWRVPSGKTGPIIEYILRAYNIDDTSVPPIEVKYNSSFLEGEISTAVPYTNYTVKISACTKGGCTESFNGVDVLTFEEAPGGVSPPYIQDSGGSYINVAWDPPLYPNGIITGYLLYMDDVIVYSGSLFSYNITQLQVYTRYMFYVRVCGRLGECTNSETTGLSTTQLPPTSMAPPSLTVLGSHRIRAEWSQPGELNGVLERYLLYMSGSLESPFEIIYNSSDLFMFHTISNLTAGTMYYVKVAGCTGGGCAISEAVGARTEESAPEGVYSPMVISPTPNVLQISWQIPQQPNGVIVQYKLYHNSLLIYTGADREYIINNLLPYTMHKLRVEACTSIGCGSSDEVVVWTKEAPPVGSLGLAVRVDNSRTVSLRWNTLERPNGIVYYNAYFEGIYYTDIENWDYSVYTSRKSLYNSTEGNDWIQVEDVIPYTTYTVQINASNTQGFILSNILQAQMPPGSPDGVKPPTLTSHSSTSIRADWGPVGRSNAQQDPSFQLLFRRKSPLGEIQNLFEQPTTATTFLKEELLPFTEYEFKLLAKNTYGETHSLWTSLTTRQDVPTSIDPPMATNIKTKSLELYWEPPFQPNGIITDYHVFMNGTLLTTVNGTDTRTEISGLLAFTTYTFSVSACTIAGCTQSAPSRHITTLNAPPEGVSEPILESTTPTSVLIVWSTPQYPNGNLLQYAIERRLNGSESITLVNTFLPTDPKQFVDESRELSPFTTYEYRIGAYTQVGVGYSAWTAITTKSSSPGGVQPPQVELLSPTSARVTWQQPISSNGILESYIVKMPNPRFEIYNISNRVILVENLVPYTRYLVTVTACSDGGCSESAPTVVTTSPSLPGGILPPTPITHSQTYISISWLPPSLPNGPNIRYELSRTKLRQPLAADEDNDIGAWSSVYAGQSSYYEDRGLTIYTTYKYRLTVYNDFGHAISDPSSEITTFGGTPTKAAVVSAYSFNHTAIDVRWITPSVIELQGGVTEYKVNVKDTSTTDLKMTYMSDVTSAVIGGLMPNTLYTVIVTIVTHGGYTIDSLPTTALTSDGAPESLEPPQLFVLNQTALRISWLPPSQPNGQIKTYNIYLDGDIVIRDIPEAGSRVLANLNPYTVYQIQVEVCTEYACLKSEPTRGTTAESAPASVNPPTLNILGAYSINATWEQPMFPNGIILRYDLMKRTLVPCDSSPTEPEEDKETCAYFECSLTESFCGSQCFSGPKTCCDGVLHDNMRGYECCGTEYVPGKTSSSDVCCGGHFYPLLQNHVCCGNRYVEVKEGEICCSDPNQDRVDIGFGDSCCATVPYSTQGAQICCHGSLYEKYGNQCCGSSVISSNLTCCVEGNKAVSYHTSPDMTCCGSKFMHKDTSVCCRDEEGNAKVHQYENEIEMTNSNEKCCGVHLISDSLSCCNGHGYNPMLHVCADISNVQNGCGSGRICSTSQASSAFCDRCDFDRSQHKCGSFKTLTSTEASSEASNNLEPVDETNSLCITQPSRIFSGSAYYYTDENLEPYTEYRYSLVAHNSAGSNSSTYTSATTQQALPEGLDAPTASVEEGQLDTIYITWEPPSKINGEILWYILLRDGIEIYRDPSTREYMDRNAIQPYRTYTYTVRMCNGQGCITSPQTKVATLQLAPEGVGSPSIVALNSSSLNITWSPPASPNGLITHYKLTVIHMGQIANLTGDVLSFTLHGLKAYEDYDIILSACTEAGCTNSSTVRGRTQQDIPQGFLPPKLVVVSATSLEIHWSVPDKPNGRITLYRIYQLSNGPFQLLNTRGANVYNYTVTRLSPQVSYQFKVEVINDAGGLNATSDSVIMPEFTPMLIGAPKNVTVLSFDSVYVEWDPPMISNGNIDQYKVLVNAGSKDQMIFGVGVSLSETIYGLLPYTHYEIRIQACLQEVANGCGTGPGAKVLTFEAQPEEQFPPVLNAKGPNSVEVVWDPPKVPNGVIIEYKIYRKLRNNSDSTGLLVNVLPGDARSFINSATDLTPFTEYGYKVEASNSIGSTLSDWTYVRTHEAPPQALRQPTISNIAAYSVSLSWSPPLQSNGIVIFYKIQYRIVSNDPTSTLPVESVRVTSTEVSTSISGLEPHTKYEMQVLAVNSAGSVGSDWVVITTTQASPSHLSSFTVEKVDTGTSAILRWQSPTKPNGVISNYLIYEKDNPNSVYQGLSKEFEYRRLQPYTNYTIYIEACTIAGCTKGSYYTFTTAEITPQDQPAPTINDVTSSSVTIRWTEPAKPNGKIVKYEILRRSNTRVSKRALTEPLVVFVTDIDSEPPFVFVDDNLEPFTTYEYKIRASNSRGSIESGWQSVETPQSAPVGVLPPFVSHLNQIFDQLKITWLPPTMTNGILLHYQIKRNTTFTIIFGPDDPKEYIDKNLLANTDYVYTLTVCNTGGFCTTSDQSVIRTPESAPYRVASPTVTAVNSTAISVTWVKPQITNGQIRVYNLKVDGTSVYSGLETSFVATNLIPYKQYSFVVEACTFGGCTESSATAGRPNEAPPSGMAPPILRVTGSNSIEITWVQPEMTNGIITSYEVRRDNTLRDTTTRFSFVDYEVEPGTQYSYTVTAFNSKGSSESPAAVATTYASAPVGLAPPVLVPLSSSTIEATWSPPLKPNGEIYNYTLYQNGSTVYSERLLSTFVGNLQPFTIYSFRIQACTSHGCATSDLAYVRTLEAPPEGLRQPIIRATSTETGAHKGVFITWEPPSRANGAVEKYEVHRRRYTGLAPDIIGGDRTLVYSGTDKQCNDEDPSLEPVTKYEYMVTAYNTEGQVSSLWEQITTNPAPPAGVLAPDIEDITSTNITLRIPQPTSPNGHLTFTVHYNEETVETSQNLVVLTDLESFTLYTIEVDACTSAGCTKSPPIQARTLSQPPEGIAPPRSANITATSVDVFWSSPLKPNGAILGYELLMRRICPYPFADDNDEVSIDCVVEEWKAKANGKNLLRIRVENLRPYTAYEFKVLVSNSEGVSNAPETLRVTTAFSVPVYQDEFPPTMTPTGNVVTVDWTKSFNINGEVDSFTLMKNGTEIYSGYATSYNIYRSNTYEVFNVRVQLKTAWGTATTPRIYFDPSSPGDTTDEPSTSVPEAVKAIPVYQEVWFIAVICLFALIVFFVALALCLKGTRKRLPYIRERMPLPPSQEKQSLHTGYFVTPYDGSVIGTDIPKYPAPYHEPQTTDALQPDIGYINPAYSQLSLPSKGSAESFLDLNLDRVSSGSSVWEEETDPSWETSKLPLDSGLHNIAYGDVYEGGSDKAVSVIKEHRMFSDTHL